MEIETTRITGKDMTAEERFWTKVDRRGEDECWLWTAGKYLKGYGMFKFGGRNMHAHRFSFRIAKHDPGALLVCHHCDNPPCVNPKHLFVGTHLDNYNDMVNKGRGDLADAQGIKNGNCRLTEHDVLTIKRCRAKGITTLMALSSLYCVSKSAVAHISSNRTWKHIDPD